MRTGSDFDEIHELLERYQRAMVASDAAGVADLYTSYGACLTDSRPCAFGTDIEARYRSMFDTAAPDSTLDVQEMVADGDLAFAVTKPGGIPTDAERARQLFVLSHVEGQWKIAVCMSGERELQLA